MNVNDLTSLLWILKMSRQSGIVLIELLGRKETETSVPWQACLQLIVGKAVSCRIYSKIDGRVLFPDEEAMHWLIRWEKREFAWMALTPEQARALLLLHQPSQVALLPPPKRQEGNIIPPGRGTAIPQPLTLAMRSWPRNHRRVFALIDGKRSVEQIATLLKLSPKSIEAILKDLSTMGFLQK